MKEKVKTLLAEAFDFTEEQSSKFEEEDFGDVIEITHPDIYYIILVPCNPSEQFSIGHYHFIPGAWGMVDGSGEPDQEEYEDDEMYPYETPIEKVVSHLVELENKYNEEMEQLRKEEEERFKGEY